MVATSEVWEVWELPFDAKKWQLRWTFSDEVRAFQLGFCRERYDNIPAFICKAGTETSQELHKLMLG